ncbi:endonuclease III [Corynebacterium sp. CCM 8862]|uniref:Endonuclease III n=1 Tax=Corynebacterium mendelii TaxID=2765362 RepID=A0A939IV18_9CORY|nr:endonuclease III [Corynebacterium mendelii]
MGRVWPDARCELVFSNPYELLVATMLSAQTTDQRVNSVTGEVFSRWPDARRLADAPVDTVARVIAPVGLQRMKAKHLVAMATAVVECHGGDIPADRGALVALSGVGRKTANVVLGNAFGIPGFPVDTHVTRLLGRLGAVGHTSPAAIERAVCAVLEKKRWTGASHRMIRHGRVVCHARRAACGVCPFLSCCPSAGKAGPADPGQAAQRVQASEDLRALLAVKEQL